MFLVCLFFAFSTEAQFEEDFGKIKIGAGFTHDFPGLNGYTVSGEFSKMFSDNLEGAFAVKRINLSGYPRTNSVNEYTKATTVDLNIYFIPLQSEDHILRIGAGYSFSFYNTRRCYPLFHLEGTTWPIEDQKGRTSGISLSGEYEYIFPSFSIGLRTSWFKAYDRVAYIGPFIGIKL